MCWLYTESHVEKLLRLRTSYMRGHGKWKASRSPDVQSIGFNSRYCPSSFIVPMQQGQFVVYSTYKTRWISFFFLELGENKSTSHVGHYLAYCTSPEWWMMMSVEQSVEWMAGETEVLGENLPPCRFVHHKSHMTWPGLESGPPLWEVGD
jgi:hypothetical protein